MLKNNLKYLIIFLLIAIAVLVGVLYWQIQKKPVGPPEEKLAPLSEPPAFKPEAKTAQKYFPYGGNAIDFREDSWQGDFEIKITKKEKTIGLDWPKEIKVGRVQVFNLGNLWDLQDHRVVFDIGNQEIKNLFNPPATTTPLIQPSSYLESPHEIGKIPQGFFNFTFYDQKFSEKSPILGKGQRYSIEIYGKDKNNQLVSGSYTFDY